MDDGSLNTACKNNSIHLHTEGFTKEEVALIRDFYCEKGYKAYMRCYKDYYMINFSTEASEKIWTEIRKYIPGCMQYKLPERHQGFFEPIIDTVEPEIILTEGFIENIQEGLHHHNIYHENELYSYDIEVEDNHNYFCQGCLVHNSLIKTWNHNGQWRFSTNGMIDAFKATYDDLESSFGDLVKEALVDEANMQSLLNSFDKNCTYMFELVSPKVQMTCYYPETKLYYLGQRDMRTMRESKEYTEQMKRCGVLTPKIYPLTTLEECLSYVKCMTKDEEGFVIKDKNFNRMKLKSPQYLMAFHMDNNGVITTKRIVKMMKNNMLDDFIAYCPQHKEQVDEVLRIIELIAHDLDYAWELEQNVWECSPEIYSEAEKREKRKELAKKICMVKYRDYIFARYDGYYNNAIDYIMNMTNSRILRWIEQKRKELGN